MTSLARLRFFFTEAEWLDAIGYNEKAGTELLLYINEHELFTGGPYNVVHTNKVNTLNKNSALFRFVAIYQAAAFHFSNKHFKGFIKKNDFINKFFLKFTNDPHIDLAELQNIFFHVSSLDIMKNIWLAVREVRLLRSFYNNKNSLDKIIKKSNYKLYSFI